MTGAAMQALEKSLSEARAEITLLREALAAAQQNEREVQDENVRLQRMIARYERGEIHRG